MQQRSRRERGHGAWRARAVAVAVAACVTAAIACGSGSSTATGDGGGGAGDAAGGDGGGGRDGPRLDAPGDTNGGDASVPADGPPGDAATHDGGGPGDAPADAQLTDCPASAQSSSTCTQVGAECEVRCPVCGVTPGGQGIYTADPIACRCQSLDPGNPSAGSAWSCEAVDCINTCVDYLDPACTTPVDCDAGVPVAPPPCGPAGAPPCAPGSYCKQPKQSDPSTWTCVPIPAACDNTPTCACLAANGVSCPCTAIDGEPFVVCGP